MSWAATTDRTARTEPGRRGFWQKLVDEHDGDQKRARNAYKAHFVGMARRSREARQAKASTPARKGCGGANE